MRVISIVIVLLFCSTGAVAATIEASWNEVTVDIQQDPENISYYIFYWGLSPRTTVHPSDQNFQYDSSFSVGNVLQVQQSGLNTGQTYYFAVVAVDSNGNVSDYSQEISFVIPDEGEDGGNPGGDDGGVAQDDSTPGTDDGSTVQDDSDPGADNGSGTDEVDIEDDGGSTNADESTGSDSKPTVMGGCNCSSHSSSDFSWLLFAIFLGLLVRRVDWN